MTVTTQFALNVTELMLTTILRQFKSSIGNLKLPTSKNSEPRMMRGGHLWAMAGKLRRTLGHARKAESPHPLWLLSESLAAAAESSSSENHTMSEKSQAIVRFVASLMPLYTSVPFQAKACALCLLDGTIVAPVIDNDIDPLDDDGWVMIYWQGDPDRKAEVPATLFASQAVLRYIDLRSAGLPPDTYRRERDILAEHFTHKTGGTLYFADGWIESENIVRMKRLGARVFGVVASALAKHLGLP